MMFPTYPRLYFHWKNPQKAHGCGSKQGIARLYNAFLEGFVEGTTPYTFPRETRGKAMLSTLDVSKDDRGSYSLKAPPGREGELAEEIRRSDTYNLSPYAGLLILQARLAELESICLTASISHSRRSRAIGVSQRRSNAGVALTVCPSAGDWTRTTTKNCCQTGRKGKRSAGPNS